MTREEVLRLQPGTARVRKVSGRYGGPGRLVEVINQGGEISVVVAHHIDGGFGEFLHIYTPAQIEEDKTP